MGFGLGGVVLGSLDWEWGRGSLCILFFCVVLIGEVEGRRVAVVIKGRGYSGFTAQGQVASDL